jgi:hypothetical protein
MLHALLDPGLFLISDTDWNNNDRRSTFLERLNKHLKFIDDVGVCSVVWCDELDERLWSIPQMQPWKMSRSCDIPMTMMLYHFFMKHTSNIDITDNAPADTLPPLTCCCDNSLGIFLQLVHVVIRNKLSAYFCPSSVNVISDDHQFKESPSSEWFTFPVVRDPSNWPKKISPVQLFWPTNRKDRDRFIKCIKYTSLAKDIHPGGLHKYQLSGRFIGDIVSASRKDRVVEMIVLRLSMNRQAAAVDPRLQDELLANGDRRFRVTQQPSSLRIHYQIKDQKIVFTRFYDEGHHDDGL